jgi:hypothetical protein
VLANEPYRSRFSFEVFGWESAKGKAAQTAYCFGPDHHGWVVLDGDGRALVCRPSHFYGEAEIRADLDGVLRR